MFENFKKKLQERIETNAVKVPNVSWTKKDLLTGQEKESIQEDVIIKRSRIPLIGDWARIYPPIDEYGKINWINTIFGGKKNFIKLLVVLGIVGLILLSYKEFFSQYDSLRESCEPFLHVILPAE